MFQNGHWRIALHRNAVALRPNVPRVCDAKLCGPCQRDALLHRQVLRRTFDLIKRLAIKAQTRGLPKGCKRGFDFGSLCDAQRQFRPPARGCLRGFGL